MPDRHDIKARLIERGFKLLIDNAHSSGFHIFGYSNPTAPSEQLDVFNGLLLTPNLVLAFDQGLISFNDSGDTLLSEELDDASKCALGPNAQLRSCEVEPAHHPYLAWRRRHLFRT